MDQRLKAFIVLGTISTIIYTIYLMTSSGENMLNASAGRDPAKQKLMVVDQDSGEISFVQKSLQVINKDKSDADQIIRDALVLLLGENLKGDTSGFIYDEKITRRAHEDEKYATKAYVDAELAKKQAKGNYQGAGNYIKYNHRIGIKVVNPRNDHAGPGKTDRNHWLNDNGCDNKYGHGDNAAWCVDDAADRMYIVSME